MLQLLTILMQKREDSSTKVEDKEERSVKKEKTGDEIEEANMVAFKEKCDVLKHDLEKPNNVNDARTNNRLEEQERSKEPHTKSSNPKEEKTGNLIIIIIFFWCLVYVL